MIGYWQVLRAPEGEADLPQSARTTRQAGPHFPVLHFQDEIPSQDQSQSTHRGRYIYMTMHHAIFEMMYYAMSSCVVMFDNTTLSI